MYTEMRLVKPSFQPAQAPIAMIRGLKPRGGNQGGQTPSRASYSALLAVLLAHAAIFAAVVWLKPEEVRIEQPDTPMVVNLVSDPKSITEEPQPEPTPPKPVVKIQKQKPVKQQIKPTPEPQPQVAEPQPAAPVEAPRAVEEAKPTPPPPPAEVVEKAPPPPPPETHEPELVTGVAYLYEPERKYPTLSKRLKEEGKVKMKVRISATGMPEDIQLLERSGFERLDNAAVEWLKAARFTPYRKNGKAVSVYAIVPMSYSLHD
jgi:periplasmic protein TonB